MNLPTITMDADEARERAEGYKTLQAPTAEEKGILAGFLALAAGKPVINLRHAVAQGGFHPNGFPKLAVCDATERFCYLTSRYDQGANQLAWTFSPRQAWARGQRGIRRFACDLPAAGTYTFQNSWGSEWRAMVPICPPNLRPTRHGRVLALSNFAVLWEVEEWERVPRPPGDPALLRQLHGDLWTVEAIWDLTPLEQAVLAGRTIS